MSWTIIKEILIADGLIWLAALMLLPGGKSESSPERLIKSLLASLPVWALYPSYKLGIPPVTNSLYEWGLAILIILALVIELIIILDFLGKERVALLTIPAQLCLSGALFIFPFFCTYTAAKQAFTSYEEAQSLESSTCPDATSQVLAAHISDSHLIENAESTTAEGDVPGNERLKDLVAEVEKYKPAYLLHSGDVTDTGSAKEWARAVEILKPVTSWTRVVLAPGNHDVSEALCSHASPECASSMYHAKVHLWRFFNAQAELFPEIKTATARSLKEELDRKDFPADIRQVATADALIDGCTKDCQDMQEEGKYHDLALGPCMRACKERHPGEAELVNEFSKNMGYWQKDGLDLFPLWWADEQRSVAIFSLEISPVGKEIGKNAVGFLDRAEVERLKGIFAKLPPTIHTVIILCHHPLTRAPGDTFSGPDNLLSWTDWQNSQWWAYALLRAMPDDAGGLITWLKRTAEAKPDTTLVIAFGHRHRRSLGSVGRVILEEAPNVSNSLYRGGLFFISRAPDQSVSAAWCNMAK